MKKVIALILSLGIVSLVSGCQSAQNRAGEGAIIGGVLGAAAGGIIGHQGHHGGEGAAIGAAAGAVTGALVGSSIPKNAQTQQPAPAMQTANPNQMGMQQIVDFTKQGINENVIIDKIRLTNSKFNLTPSDITYLKQQGVSQNVINVMQGA